MTTTKSQQLTNPWTLGDCCSVETEANPSARARQAIKLAWKATKIHRIALRAMMTLDPAASASLAYRRKQNGLSFCVA